MKGAVLLPHVLGEAILAELKSKIDDKYRKLEAAREQSGLGVANSGLIATGQRFVPTASSLTMGAIVPDERLQAIIAGIAASAAGTLVREELGGSTACDLDQAWVRRQYAPRNYPRFHAPHGWHQDGALGFDFLLHRDGIFPPDALLPMVTCWIALGSCGTKAPGLEVVRQRLAGLLPPVELADGRVRARFRPEEFWRPVMEPGGALLFRGDVLHRTHVTPAMTQDRTSIELRFFSADKIPERLKGDRFVSLG